MAAVTDHRGSDSSFGRGLRRFVPWVVLAIIVLTVMSYYNGYKRNAAVWDAQQNKPSASQTASATAPAKKSAAATTTKTKASSAESKLSKVVVVSAVTFRKDPSSTAAAIRDLESGDELTLVGQVGSWYKVTDAKGVIGWVTASEKYTKLVSK